MDKPYSWQWYLQRLQQGLSIDVFPEGAVARLHAYGQRHMALDKWAQEQETKPEEKMTFWRYSHQPSQQLEQQTLRFCKYSHKRI